MKTLYLTYRAGLTVDSENNTVSEMKSTRNAVGDVYLITEDMQVITGNSVLQGDTEKYTGEQFDAKAGDIILSFYESKYPHKFVLIHSNEWKENIDNYNNIQQAEKEKWASDKTLKSRDCECENCGNCCCDNAA